MAVSLLQFQGSDGSTTIVDETGRAWAAVGDAALETTGATFGVSSLDIPDTSSYVSSTDDLAAVVPGTGDFAIQIWVTGVTSAATLYAADNGIVVAINQSDMLFFFDTDTGVYHEFFTAALSINMTDGNPLYICVQRNAGVLEVFVRNAFLFYTTQPEAANLDAVPNVIGLGRRLDNPSSRPMVGRFDGFRMLVGETAHDSGSYAGPPSPLDYSEGPGAATIEPFGIPSAEAFGVPVIGVGIAPASVESGQSFGAPVVSLSIGASGIPTTEALGSPSVGVAIAPTGIASAEAAGQPTIGVAIGAVGIASAEAFGTPVISVFSGEPAEISCVGIASAEAFGVPHLRLYAFERNRRTFVVDAEDRVYAIDAEDRTITVQAEDRVYAVAAEERAFA